MKGLLEGGLAAARWVLSPQNDGQRQALPLRGLFVILCCWLGCGPALAQVVHGQVRDATTGEGLPGATVLAADWGVGALADANGAFRLALPAQGANWPVQLRITQLGYDTLSIALTQAEAASHADPQRPLILTLQPALQDEVEINALRVADALQLQSLTIERLDTRAILETPAVNFYDALGALKGVDITTAAMGFKIINTRGFNSTYPVRSLQLIDGIDNQSPVLNASLGNFVGTSELDVQTVDIVAGPSTALYGPGAFNGVIKISTKSAWDHPGLSVLLKTGERGLLDAALRWAKVFPAQQGGQPRWAFKFNIAYMKAYDWEANNLEPTSRSLVGTDNPGGYDAVNRYGDENLYDGQNNYTSAPLRLTRPGLGIFHRTGYLEAELVDYNTYSAKLDAALCFKPLPQTPHFELLAGVRYASGTTVFMADNRYSFKNFSYLQHRIEVNLPLGYVRFYHALDNTGQSYDAVFTALLLQERAKRDAGFTVDYDAYWTRFILPRFRALTGFDPTFAGIAPDQRLPYVDSLLALVPADTLTAWHRQTRAAVDANQVIRPRARDQAFLQPGSPDYIDAFNQIISQPFKAEPAGTNLQTASDTTRGAHFISQSQLMHLCGEHRLAWWGNRLRFTVGGSTRLYLPNTRGTVYSDTLLNPAEPGQGYRRLWAVETGVYGWLQYQNPSQIWPIAASLRADYMHNVLRNYSPVLSPALSVVWAPQPTHSLRLNATAGGRNPTLAEQFLYYNVGRAILLGNATGLDSVATLGSVVDYINYDDPRRLQYLTLAPLRPERAYTLEAGYRGIVGNPGRMALLVDFNAYYSIYQNFIGYMLVAYPPLNGQQLQPYRVAVNATNTVAVQGASLGLTCLFGGHYALGGNITYNELSQQVTTDTIIPAFNTPRLKANLSLTGRDIVLKIGGRKLPPVGFQVAGRWVEGFRFEGSPQFTGPIASYALLDAQLSMTVVRWHAVFKVGASNVLDTPYNQAYGAPAVGRLAYGRCSSVFE